MSKSENGWEPLHAGADILNWIDVPGTNPVVRLQLMKGWPTTVLRAFAADFNAYVEPLRDGDSAGFTATNSVATSNHLNGTAMDLNWDGPPEAPVFRYGITGERAYPGDKLIKLRDLLMFYEDIVYCGGFWSIRDWMHMQMGYNTWMNPKTQDFINRKIRADGFSTYKRDGAPPPPPPPPPPPSVNAATTLANATGISVARAVEILPQVSFALIKANCTNPRRIAAALAQWVVESGHFKYTEEIASGPESQERWKYKGRTWIQITWLENYKGFSQWCHNLGLVPTSDYFVVRPKELADQKWAALGPAYWWAIKYPQINEYADRGDIDNVSKWVNAPAWVDNPNKHANGEKERRDAYNKALALGDQLLTLVSGTPTQGEDDLSAEAERKIDVIYQELTKRFPSRSRLRWLDERGDGPVDTLAGMVLNDDGNDHVLFAKTLAELGHPPTLELLRHVAGGDPAKYPHRADDIKLAQAILADIAARKAQPGAASSITAIDDSRLKAENERLREENRTLQAALEQARAAVLATPPQPNPEPAFLSVRSNQPVGIDEDASPGQTIGQAYDAIHKLKLADALPIEDRATLNALLAILETKNGADLRSNK